MGFSKQEYWIGLPCPPPGDLLNPGIKLASLILLHWQAGRLFTTVRKKERKSEVTQLCLTLSDPMDCSLPGSSVRGISRQEYFTDEPLRYSIILPISYLSDGEDTFCVWEGDIFWFCLVICDWTLMPLGCVTLWVTYNLLLHLRKQRQRELV